MKISVKSLNKKLAKLFVINRFFGFIEAILFGSVFYCAFVILHDLKNGIETGKTFFFIYCISILFLILLVRFIFHHKKGFYYEINKIDLFVIIFFFYIIIRTLFLQPELLVSIELIQLVLIGAFYAITKSLFKKDDVFGIYLVILIFLSCGFFQALYGLQQLYGLKESYHSLFKVTGTFFNPAPFSGYLVSVFPMGLAIYFHFNCSKYFWKIIAKYFALITTTLIVLILPTTLSRAAWIAFLVGVCIVCVEYNKFKINRKFLSTFQNRIRFFFIILFIAISFCIGLFFWKKDSALGRVLIWRVTINMVKEAPFFGVGINQYNPEFGKHQAAYFKQEGYSNDEALLAGKGEYAFNEPLQILTEYGSIGLMLFLGIIFFAFKSYKEREISSNNKLNSIALGAVGGLASILTFSLFSYPFSVTPLFLNFFFLLAILSALGGLKSFYLIKVHNQLVLKISLVFFLFFFLWVLNTTTYRYNALKSWKTASLYNSYGDYEEAIEVMKEIEFILKNNGDFMLEYGQTLAEIKKNKHAVKVLEHAKDLISDPYLFISLGNCYKELEEYKKSELAYKYAFNLIPHKFYPKYLLVKLYIEIGEFEKAIAAAHEILSMNIKINSPQIEEIRGEMKLILSNYNSSSIF